MKIIISFFLLCSFGLYANSSKIIVAVKVDKVKLLDPKNHPNIKHTQDVKRWIKRQIEGLAGAAERESIEIEYHNRLRAWEVYEGFIANLNKKIDAGYPEVETMFPETEKVKIIKYDSSKYSHYILYIKFHIDHSPPLIYAVPELHNTQTHEVVWLNNRRYVVPSEWINDPKFKGDNKITGDDLAEMTWKKFLDKDKTVIQNPTKLSILVKKNIPYARSVDIIYKHNKRKQIANGKDEGFIKIIEFSDVLKFGYPKPYNLAEYTLTAKQGVFTKTNSKEIKFTPYDYLQARKKLKFKYKTYNCNQKNIRDKEFETFILTRNNFLGAENSTYMGKVKLIEKKVNFRCKPYYFIIETKIKEKYISRKTKGANSMINTPNSLISSWNTTHISKQIMHIDAARGSIKMAPLKGDGHKIVRGKYYKFNNKNCTYEPKSNITKDENIRYSIATLKHHNIGLVDDDKATIELEVSDTPFKKIFSINWKTLENSSSWSGDGAYHNMSTRGDMDMDLDKIPEGMEEVSALGNTIKNLILAQRKAFGAKSKEMTQEGIKYFARSEEEACHQKRGHEFFFVNKKITKSTDIEVDIKIRDATKYEIDLMENIVDNSDIRTFRARKKPIKRVSRYEKDASSSLGAIENMMYDQLSNRGKKEWDKADKEHEDAIKNKKDVEEFDNLSIDDLEMFTK